MTGVYLYAAIIRSRKPCGSQPGTAAVNKPENICLKPAQHGLRQILIKAFPHRKVQLCNQIEKLTAVRAPGCQQGMALLKIRARRDQRRGSTVQPGTLGSRYLPSIHNMDWAHTCAPADRLTGDQKSAHETGADTICRKWKDAQAACFSVPGGSSSASKNKRTWSRRCGSSTACNQGAPQLRLPGFLLIGSMYQPVGLPGLNHIRPVDKILVKCRGNAACQLIAHARMWPAAYRRRPERTPAGSGSPAADRVFSRLKYRVQKAMLRHQAERGAQDPTKPHWDSQSAYWHICRALRASCSDSQRCMAGP